MRMFVVSADRADRSMRAIVWNEESDQLEFERETYLGQISGSSQQRMRTSLAMDALDWAKEQGIDPYSIDFLSDYVDIEK